jgi:hypothetical protein
MQLCFVCQAKYFFARQREKIISTALFKAKVNIWMMRRTEECDKSHS